MNLDELERLAKAATPGEWEPDGDTYNVIAPDPDYCWVGIAEVFHNSRHDEGRYNRDLICACSPQSILAMIECIRAADDMEQAFRTGNNVGAWQHYDAARAKLEGL